MNIFSRLHKKNRELDNKIRAELLSQELTGLSPVEAYVLYELYKQDGERPSDLAAKVGRPATAFTPVVDSLEKIRLIERRSNGKDRRSIFVYLTNLGWGLQKSIMTALDKVESEFKL